MAYDRGWVEDTPLNADGGLECTGVVQARQLTGDHRLMQTKVYFVGRGRATVQ
jgi:hypothetical protein